MELLAPRYMTRFRCLGSACEDSCCRGWTVHLDRAHYDKLRERMASPEERAELNAKVKRSAENRPDKYALFVIREDSGACSFVDASGLCTIHSRYGEDYLGNTCATYPRAVGRIGERHELVGVTSCPEVARLALLHEDALDLVPVDREVFGRGWITRELEADEKDPYNANFLAVRGLVIELLQRRKFPLGSRLFFVAFFADRSRGYLKRGARNFDADALRELGQSMRLTENLETLHRQIQRSLVDVSYAIRVVREVLRVIAGNLPTREQSLVGDIVDLFAAKDVSLDGDALAILRAYNALPPLPAERAARLDAILERYVAHDLFDRWFVSRPSFIAYYHQLLAQAATIRFLVNAHARGNPPADAAAFDALAIRVIYLQARLVEHSAKFVEGMRRAFEEEGLELGHALALTRL